MSLESALPSLVGEISRFGEFADRVEGLIESQTARYRPNSSDWLVLPWGNGFCLFSEDTEGQRRGRESVVAFLGPSVVSVETVSVKDLQATLPHDWKSFGLCFASFLRRKVPGNDGANQMLSRLEDMVATLRGRTWRPLELKPTHADLLRDFRLALLGRDDGSASRLLDELCLDGHLSAENLRYLRIEFFAAFSRWVDMRAMPHIEALLKTRRPQAISEVLMQMVWWTELAGTTHKRALDAFNDKAILQTFGQLLRSVRVPTSREGRLVGFLTALVDGDAGRQQAILDSASDAGELAQLQGLVNEANAAPDTDLSGIAKDPLAAAFEAGRFSYVVKRFIDDPLPVYADIAVQAVLEAGLTEHASLVSDLVRGFIADGSLTPGRRARRDLEELEHLASNACDGWSSWAKRISGATRWADGSSIARGQGPAWASIGQLGADQISTICEALIEASGGTNDDQLRASLDILCNEAALQVVHGIASDFSQTILLLLAEQDNFSEMVRIAYLNLFSAWLNAGPGRDEYRKVLDQTIDIWNAIESPNAIGWAAGVLEAAADATCPNKEARTAFAVHLINRVRQLYGRASLRGRIEIESLAEDLGLPSLHVDVPDEERHVWSVLDGKLLGVYSLLPRAAALLGGRLTRLTSVQVKGNDDKVATPGLRALAERADYFIVDTWHAAHQATAAIDAVRSKDRQILPQQRGISGFLRSLEAALEG